MTLAKRGEKWQDELTVSLWLAPVYPRRSLTVTFERPCIDTGKGTL